MKTKSLLDRKIKFAFGSAIVILLVIGTFSYRSLVSSNESDRWVQHTHEVLENLQGLLFAGASIESNSRGFVLTGEKSQLESYRISKSDAGEREIAVRNLTVDNPDQQRQLPALEGLFAQKLQWAEMIIDLRQAQGFEAAAEAVRSGRGQQIADEFQSVVRHLQDKELGLLAQRNANEERDSAQTKTVLILGTALGLLIAAAAGWSVQRDMSRRGLAEDALRDSSEQNRTLGVKYRGLLEAAPDAMVVVNQGGEIVLLNLQAEKQFGYRRDELVGQKVKSIIPQGFAERLFTDGLRSAEDALAQQIGTGIELIARRKDGSEFPIELMLSPLKSAEGILVTAAIRDISARKEADEALLASEERLRMTVDAAEMGTWFYDLQRDEVSCSEQFRTLFGLTSDVKMTHQACLDRAHPDDKERIDQAVKNTVELGVPYHIEHRVIWPDSSVHWLTAKGGAHRNSEGVAVHMQGIIVDITERKAAQEALKHQEAMERRSVELMRSNDDLQQFAYIAAHDLQEPLRIVASYTQLLSRRYTGKLDSDADEFIAYAVDGAHRMQLLIEDLLTYCRAGTAGKAPQEISSAAALEQALLNLQGAIQDSGGVVTHDPLPTVIVDGAQLVQLFQNIVGNALKYRSAETPRVHVSAKKNRDGEWIFSMQDNGLGIEPQYFEKIFVMFQRLHGREEFSGTGIGLTLCKKIAERHGGRMWVDSNPGKGSTFYLALPERG